MADKKTKAKGSRKHGRSKRKGMDTALSLYVRNKISPEAYFKAKGIKIKK